MFYIYFLVPYDWIQKNKKNYIENIFVFKYILFLYFIGRRTISRRIKRKEKKEEGSFETSKKGNEVGGVSVSHFES